MSGTTVRPIHCSRCGAPLTVSPGVSVVTCGYCQQSHAVLAPPPAAPAGASYRVGDEVAAMWGGAWWPAVVLRELGGGGYRIHYEGWDGSWDEIVGPDRLCPR